VWSRSPCLAASIICFASIVRTASALASAANWPAKSRSTQPISTQPRGILGRLIRLHGAAYSEPRERALCRQRGGGWTWGHEPTRSLRALRERRGLTQGQLAERLGVTHLTIRSWEKGERPMREQWRQKVAEALSCSVADVRQAEGVARGKRWRRALVNLGVPARQWNRTPSGRVHRAGWRPNGTSRPCGRSRVRRNVHECHGHILLL
jgi:DNA-binding XRE family transcriptional regulator